MASAISSLKFLKYFGEPGAWLLVLILLAIIYLMIRYMRG